MNSLKSHFGELWTDNRCSGDEVPGYSGMGTHFSTPTLACKHCGGVWVINPLRTRPREYCKHCNLYICDTCYGLSKQPDYVHRTIDDLTEMVKSGKWTIVGGTVHCPVLKPTTGVK